MQVRLFVLMALSLSLFAQTSQITGRISDPSGAVVPAGEVTVSNVATGDKRSVASNQQGYFNVPFLEPGEYEVRVQAAGFKPVTRSGVKLQVDQVARLDFTLELGSLSEGITVTGEAPLVESETSSVGQVINNKSIVEMPLNGRNAWHLAQLTPATVFVRGIGDAGEIPVASMAGGRAYSQSLLVDGGSVQKSGMSRAMAELAPMVDAVEEFKVITNNYSAEYGRTAGGVFTAVTKSGTNEFRGTAFEFMRNDALDARDFFAVDKASLRYNQFGGTLGGPIIKDRTHFFVALEATKQSLGETAILTLPTPDQKRGIFTGLTDVAGRPIQLYNPFTTRPDPQNPSQMIRDPFPNNVIPQSQFDPVAVRAMSYYPDPNVAGNAAGANNFIRNLAGKRTQYHGTVRVDHIFTPRDRVFVRYLDQFNDRPQVSAFSEPAASGAGTASSRAIKNLAHTIMGSYIRTVSASLISDTRFSWLKQSRDVLHESIDGDWPTKLGLTGVSNRAFPAFAPQGYTFVGARNAFREQRGPTYQIIQTLTWIRGSHGFKAGFEYRWNGQQDEFDTVPSGDMTFGQQGTGIQRDARSGNGFASMLLGFVTNASLRDQIPLRTRSHYIGGFVQDDWKVTPRFTLNLGVRYDIEPPPYSPENTMSGFDMNAIHPTARIPGVITFLGVDGQPRRLADTDRNNIAPRFGFAWRPSGSDTTVLRGGYGVFFGNTNDIGYLTGPNLGFSTQAQFVSPDQNQTPAFLLRNGFPAFPQAGPEFRTPAFGVGGPVNFYERARATPYSQQFNFGVQHQIAGILVESQYIGNLGRKLTSQDVNINQVRPERVGGPGTIQSRRPYPQFTNVLMVAPNWGSSSYHGVSFRAEKRYQSGFQFLFNYTYSKFIDNVDMIANGDFAGTPGVGYQDFYNRRLDKALSPNDITHNVRFNTIWEMPFGKGQPWLQTGPLAYILGGWQLSVLGSIYSGAPYGVVTNVNTCECFSAGPQRADILRDPTLPSDQRSPAQWFDTDAFAQPARFMFGNAARSVGRLPGLVNFDTGIMKNFPIGEQVRLQFRGEMFNALNHANFGNPGTSLGSPNFGVINSTAPARIVQFGLKLYF